jgi:hypothetical protein
MNILFQKVKTIKNQNQEEKKRGKLGLESYMLLSSV